MASADSINRGVPVVTGTPVAGSSSSVPVGLPVDADSQTQALLQAKARFRDDLEEISRSLRREFQSSLDVRVGVAQARVSESVQSSIDFRLPRALHAHLQDHAATQPLVTDVTHTLQRRVEADAASVVARLASQEAASHELSKALEAQCMARVDERVRSLWAAWFVGGALTAGALWWLGGGVGSGGVPSRSSGRGR